MIFAKKQADETMIKDFWSWFAGREKWIIETYKTDGAAVVWAVDEKLTRVFSYFKKEIEFQLGFNDGKGEFFFFDLNNKNLNRDAKRFAALMPEELKNRWDFIIKSE